MAAAANASTDTQDRGNRRVLQGIVISDSMDKSVVVRVERTTRHPKYGKFIRRHKNYMAHDEGGEIARGDIVEIVSIRPMSKRKRWRVSNVVQSLGYVEGSAAEKTDQVSEQITHAHTPQKPAPKPAEAEASSSGETAEGGDS